MQRLETLLGILPGSFSRGSEESGRTFRHLEDIGFRESADFIREHLSTALLFDDKREFWHHALGCARPEGLFLELGVYLGTSINFFGQHLASPGQKIYGFDSFEGLSEDWGGTPFRQGTWSLGGRRPRVEANVVLVPGLVEDTLPGFVDQKVVGGGEKITFMHMDLDSYRPTRTALVHTVDHLTEGSVIIFDELLGYPGWRENEYRALREVILPAWDIEFLSFCEPYVRRGCRSRFVRAAVRTTRRLPSPASRLCGS